MSEMTEQETRVLNLISIHEPIMASELTRRLWGVGVRERERDDAIQELLERSLIKKHRAKFRLRKPGPPPTMYETTHEGRTIIEDLAEQENMIGAC